MPSHNTWNNASVYLSIYHFNLFLNRVDNCTLGFDKNINNNGMQVWNNMRVSEEIRVHKQIYPFWGGLFPELDYI